MFHLLIHNLKLHLFLLNEGRVGFNVLSLTSGKRSFSGVFSSDGDTCCGFVKPWGISNFLPKLILVIVVSFFSRIDSSFCCFFVCGDQGLTGSEFIRGNIFVLV